MKILINYFQNEVKVHNLKIRQKKKLRIEILM